MGKIEVFSKYYSPQDDTWHYAGNIEPFPLREVEEGVEIIIKKYGSIDILQLLKTEWGKKMIHDVLEARGHD